MPWTTTPSNRAEWRRRAPPWLAGTSGTALATLAALAALVFAVWWPALGASFQFDDFNVIVGNPRVHSLSAWLASMPGIRPLLKQVTAFTVAHSLTLGLAMLGVVHLPSRIVEPLIALSIAVVAVENIFSQKVNPARWMIVFGFGLVHGLGFAGVLSELGVPRGQFLPALLSFNVGVEFGQLAVILAAALLTWPVIRREWYHRRVTVPASLGIAAIGLYWAVTRALGRG